MGKKLKCLCMLFFISKEDKEGNQKFVYLYMLKLTLRVLV